MKTMKRGKYEMTRFDLYTPRIARDLIEIEADKFNIPPRTYGRTWIFGIFIVEIVGDEENPKTKRRWYGRVKESIEDIGRNWRSFVLVWELLVYVWDKFSGM